MRKLSLRLHKKIENLLIIIMSVGQSSHYLQQACISNLLVTVFAARRFDRLLITENYIPTSKIINIRQPAKN
jgi:hypothetical protein